MAYFAETVSGKHPFDIHLGSERQLTSHAIQSATQAMLLHSMNPANRIRRSCCTRIQAVIVTLSI